MLWNDMFLEVKLFEYYIIYSYKILVFDFKYILFKKYIRNINFLGVEL